MKTLKNKAGELKRANDLEAHNLVQGGKWNYVPKSEWKIATRPAKVEKKES